MPSDVRDYEYDEWPVTGRENADVQYVGMPGPGAQTGAAPPARVNVFYDETEGTLFGAEIDEDEERIVPVDDREWDVSPGETLGEAIERVGEKTGWDSLSEFAQEHLEDDE